jgi:nucleotide-binding universal stress UspA family protein
MPMKMIVVAVDGSEHSERALRMGIDIAGKFGADVRIVSVVEPTYLPPEPYGLAEQVDRATREEAARLVGVAVKSVTDAGVKASGEVLDGSPADAVARVADEVGADLVVVGSRGKGALGRLFLGSVSDRLVHFLRRPVLVVH